MKPFRLNLSFCLSVLAGAILFAFSASTVEAAESVKQPQKAIRIGAVFSLSGFGAKGGLGELRAAQLAVEDLGRSAAVGGRAVELIVEDNKSDLALTVAAYRKLVDLDQVDGIIGPNWSEFTEVVAPIVERLKVPTITPSGVLPPSERRRFFFSMMQAPERVQYRSALAVRDQLKAQRVVGLVHENSYLMNAWRASRSVWGTSVATEEILLPVGNPTDFRSIISRLGARQSLEATQDTVVYASLLPGSYLPFLKARAQVNSKLPVFAVDVLYDESMPLDATLLDGVLSADFKVLGSTSFHERFRKRFGQPPLNYAAKAYDALRLLAESTHRCGSRNPVCLKEVDEQGESGHLKFDSDNVQVAEGELTDLYFFEPATATLADAEASARRTGSWKVQR